MPLEGHPLKEKCKGRSFRTEIIFPLHLAAELGDHDMVDLLMKAGVARLIYHGHLYAGYSKCGAVGVPDYGLHTQYIPILSLLGRPPSWLVVQAFKQGPVHAQGPGWHS